MGDARKFHVPAPVVLLVAQRSLFQATPAERHATLIALGIGLGFLVVLMGVAALSGRGRRNSVRPILVFVGGVLASLAALSLYTDSRPVVTGVVVDRGERIVRRDAVIEPEYRLSVEYTPPGWSESRTERLAAGEELFDRYAEGDTVAIRFVDLGGVLEFGRLAERTTWSMIDPALLVLPGLLVLLVAGTALAVRITGNGRLWIAGVVLACVLLLSAHSIGQLMLLLPVGEPTATATARVTYLSSYSAPPRGNSRSIPLPFMQPIDIVEMELTPPGATDPVEALDVVDAGSHDARVGDPVAVVYRAGRPRGARIENAGRSHAWKNTLHLWVLYFVVAPLVVLWMRRRALRPAMPGSAPRTGRKRGDRSP